MAHLDCRNPGGVQAKPCRNVFGPFRAGNYAGNANLFRGFHPRLLRLFPFGERITGGADIVSCASECSAGRSTAVPAVDGADIVV